MVVPTTMMAMTLPLCISGMEEVEDVIHKGRAEDAGRRRGQLDVWQLIFCEANVF